MRGTGGVTGVAIKELRRALKLTQAGLASVLKVHRTAVSHWERGKHAPSPPVLARLNALGGERLRIVPLHLRDALAFVKAHHRHHVPPVGAKFVVGAAAGARLVGVAIVGRPVSRALDDRFTLEVTRVATDGTRNSNSLLYGAAWRTAKALGYSRLITYTLPTESGASLRAVGWTLAKRTRGGSWNCASRPRQDKHRPQAPLADRGARSGSCCLTVVSLTYVAHAQRGLRRLEATLRQQPPPGVTPEFVEAFFAEFSGQLVAELSQLLASQIQEGPEYATPGTALRWKTLRDWLSAYRALKRQPPSFANHEALVQHFLVLPDSLVLSAGTEDLEAFRKALRWIRPAPEDQNNEHRYSHLRALLEQARKRLRRSQAAREAR